MGSLRCVTAMQVSGNRLRPAVMDLTWPGDGQAGPAMGRCRGSRWLGITKRRDRPHCTGHGGVLAYGWRIVGDRLKRPSAVRREAARLGVAMEGRIAPRRQPVFRGDRAKHVAALHAPRGESAQVLDHAVTGLLQVGVGSHTECAARILHQHGQCPDASARIRQEQRS